MFSSLTLPSARNGGWNWRRFSARGVAVTIVGWLCFVEGKAMSDIAIRVENLVPVIFPVHPRTRRRMENGGGWWKGEGGEWRGDIGGAFSRSYLGVPFAKRSTSMREMACLEQESTGAREQRGGWVKYL